MTPLYFLNSSEVKLDRGEIYLKPFFGKYFLCGVVSFLLFLIAAAVVSGMFGFSLLAGISGAIGGPAVFHNLLKRELEEINSDRRQPHKVFHEIIDWEEGDSIELTHFKSRRLEYLGVTDDFRIILGKRRRLTPILDEKYTKKEKYRDIFSVPAFYLRRYTEENEGLDKRMTKSRKETLLENKGTYQEYLDTISQEKKKLNGNV